MAAKFSDVIEYFKMIASQHIQIGHSEAEKHFYRFELEEVLTGLKKMNYPALILEGYAYSFVDNKSDNVIKRRSCAFMLVNHLKDIGDFTAMHEIWDSQEQICDDILSRIKSDKYNPKTPAVRDFDIHGVEVVLIANENDKNYGIRCTFSMASSQPMNYDPDKWNLE